MNNKNIIDIIEKVLSKSDSFQDKSVTGRLIMNVSSQITR